MKTTFSNETAMNGMLTNSTSETSKPSANYDATISIDDDDIISATTAKYMSVKRTLPVTINNANSLTYEKYIVRFDQGTPKRWLSFLKDWDELKTQLNLTTGPELYSNFKTLLTGDTLDKWNLVVTANGTHTAEHFGTCLQDMTTCVFPENALSTQQAYLSNLAKKPSGMSWRQYDVRLHQENSNLKMYPPNFNQAQCLPDAVLMGMVHRTVPNYFRKQVKTQGFDIQTKSTKQLIQFF